MILPTSFTLYDMIERNARLNPNGDCIVFQDKRLSFRQYQERCDKLAAGLCGNGIKNGDRLGVVENNSDEYMILYGAAAKIGAILVPVNWRLQQEELEYVLNDSSARWVFVGGEYRNRVAEASGKLKSVERCYVMGRGEADGFFRPLDELYSKDSMNQKMEVLSDSGFLIIHTAAVQGKPRGAFLSQANIVLSNVQMMHLYGLRETDCAVCVLPLFHIAGISLAMAIMHAGGKSVFLEKFDPERTLKHIDEEKGTTFVHFPPILKTLTETHSKTGGQFSLSSLRNVGGLDHPENILGFKKIAPNARFFTAFGQTEAMPITAGLIEERPGSAGKPTCLSKVAIHDDYDNEAPTGTAGEICVRSPVVFLGYWGHEEETAHAFRAGWHHTGDIGRFDEDGYLWYVKRKAEKELVKPGGENVYPAEVEKVILSHGKVIEVSVIGVPDQQWGEAVKAVCVLSPGVTMDSQELIDFVGARIARYKRPKYVVFVDSLPKTADGEIDRDQIKSKHGGKF